MAGTQPQFAVDLDEVTIHADVAGRSIAIRLAPAPDENRAARAGRPRGAPADPSTSWPRCPERSSRCTRQPGQHIEAGEPVVTLEAMKMEHVVAAPRTGSSPTPTSGPATRSARPATRDGRVGCRSTGGTRARPDAGRDAHHREELLVLHEQARRRRNAAELGGKEWGGGESRGWSPEVEIA